MIFGAGCRRDTLYYFEDDKKNVIVSVCEKYTLTIKEPAEYFNIGIKKMRRLEEDNEDKFAIYMRNRYLFIRERFEQYIVNLSRGGEMKKNEKNRYRSEGYNYTDRSN